MNNIYPFDFFLNGITVEFIIIAIVVIIGIVYIRQQQTLRFNLLDGLLHIFVIWHGGRLMTASPYFNGWILVQTIGCLAIYYWGRHICSAFFFFRLLFFTAMGEAIWGILQWQGILPSYHILFTTTGSFPNPALWGIFCACGLLAGVTLFGKCHNIISRILWSAGILLLVTAIILSASRAIWLALTTGIYLIGRTSDKGKAISLQPYAQNKNARYLLIGTTIVIIGYLTYFLYSLRPDSIKGRFLIWQVIAKEIPNAILSGHGPLQAHYMPLQASWFATHPNSTASMLAGENVYAFNVFLKTIFESGLIGLFLLAWILITAFHKILDKDKNTRYAGSILLAIVCFGCFSYPFSSASITAIAISSLAIMAKEFTTLEWQIPILSPKFAIFTGLLFLTYTTTEYAIAKSADLYLHRAQYQPNILQAHKPLCYSHLQGNSDFMLAYGKILYNHEHYADALPILQKASCLKPSCRLWCDIGDCHQHLNNPIAAEEYYKQAACMIPSRIFPHYCLFKLYCDKEYMEKAAEKAKYMLTMPVKVVNTSVLRYRHQAKQFLNQYTQNQLP